MILMLLRLNYLLLLVVGIAGLFFLAPASMNALATGKLAAITYLPLLAMLPAIISGDRRLCTWLCFLLLFYFCVFVVQLTDTAPIRTLAVAKTSLTVVLFVLAALQTRWQAHAD
ncbi:MAG: DUF2069 domain-containing protein [Alcanivorax sp.]|nr:DUF2069 domain-containing protein [Alcanivorax sp.]